MPYRKALTNVRRKKGWINRGVKARRRLASRRRSVRGRSNRFSRRTLVRSGFPTKLTVKLAYHDTISLDADAGPDGFKTYVFRANSCYDPDFTGTGHQPMMFDQYMQIYDHYQVKWSSIKVTNIPKDTIGNTYPPIWGVYLGDEATAVNSMSNVNQLLEQRDHGPYKMSGMRDNSTNLRLNTIKRWCNLRRFLGNKDASLQRGDASSNPAEMAFFIIWVSARTILFNPAAEQFEIDLSFIVEFSEPRLQPQS